MTSLCFCWALTRIFMKHKNPKLAFYGTPISTREKRMHSTKRTGCIEHNHLNHAILTRVERRNKSRVSVIMGATHHWSKSLVKRKDIYLIILFFINITCQKIILCRIRYNFDPGKILKEANVIPKFIRVSKPTLSLISPKHF